MKHDATPTFTADMPLAAIALHGDAYAAVLDRHRLDFCCQGARTLAEACRADDLVVGRVLAELDAAAPAGPAAPDLPTWTERSVPELIDHVVATHHAFTRTAIARIELLMVKVVTKHGAHRVELPAVAASFTALAAELGPHLMREERVLFPYIRALASPGGAPPAPFGTVRNPLRMMLREHERAGQVLTDLFEETDGFVAPPDACASYRALYAALAELRLDLLRHISLENNLLFPRALALEADREATTCSGGSRATPGPGTLERDG
jgi:regulator of cell morphogenesis and NO signaling